MGFAFSKENQEKERATFHIPSVMGYWFLVEELTAVVPEPEGT